MVFTRDSASELTPSIHWALHSATLFCFVLHTTSYPTEIHSEVENHTCQMLLTCMDCVESGQVKLGIVSTKE